MPQIGGCNTISATFVKKYVRKLDTEFGVDHFEGVRGDVTVVTQLDGCLGTGGGGTFVEMANMQTSTGPGIVQLAYGQKNAGDPKRFYWTPNGTASAVLWPGSLVPVEGHRIRGTITKAIAHTGATVAHYVLFDITANTTETADGTYPAGDMSMAWWGVERLDTAAQLGSTHVGAFPDTHLAYMGYRANSSAPWTFRSGLVASDIKNEGAVQTCERALVGTWVYGNDMVDYWNTCA